MTVETPELDKAMAVKDKCNAIDNFLDWLRHEKRIFLVQEVTYLTDDLYDSDGKIDAKKVQSIYQPQSLINEYYDLDAVKMEEERVALLDEVRKKNAQND